MAYRKKSTARRSRSSPRSTTRRPVRRSTARRAPARRAVKRKSSAPRTLRIVIEQPAANVMAGPLVPASEKAPRRAKF